MRFVRENRTHTLPEEPIARFFVQLWYDMVHRNSLDSHRVRCMESLNILRELQDLLHKPFLKDNNDVKRTTEECIHILKNDPVVRAHFTPHLARILPLLQEILDIKNEKQMPRSVFSFYLKDFVSDLEARYKSSIIDDLEQALFKSKSEDAVFHCTALLLSRLLDEGHSLEGLFGIVTNVFINYKAPDTTAFLRNFDLAKRLMMRSASEYEVIFRLEFAGDVPVLSDPILGVRFYKDLEEYRRTLKVARPEQLDLLTPRYGVLFALVRAVAQEDRSAGLKARDDLDTAIDLIRYELEQEVVSVAHEFISVRTGSNSARPFALPSQIPNPERNIRPEDFQQFIRMTEAISRQDTMEAETKKKISSAFRFYRMGRDAKEFENKFLNWWTGLEYLVRSGGGGIIDGVEKMIVSILVLSYMSKLLASFAEAFTACGIAPSTTTCTKFAVDDYSTLNADDFLSLLHDAVEIAHIQPSLADYPLLRFRLDRFRQDTRDAASIKALMDRHETHLRWHIHRIYQVRCYIVHSAEYSLNLTLLSANLEYYIKSSLSLVLEKLTLNSSINSLNELYDRMVFEMEAIQKELEANRTDSLRLMIRTGKV